MWWCVDRVVPAYAALQLALGVSLWAAWPSALALNAYSAAGAACLLLELGLMARLDRSLRDPSDAFAGLGSLCFQGAAIAFPWLLTVYFTAKLALGEDGRPPLPPAAVFAKGGLGGNATWGNGTTAWVGVEPLGLYPGCVLFTSVTQLRVFGLLIMDVLASLSPFGGGRQGTVVYHVESDDSYVMTWEMDHQLSHASYTNILQITQLEWGEYVKDVKDWSRVPNWAKLRLCSGQSSAG